MSANLTYLSRLSKQFRQFLGRFFFAARISGEVGRFATVAPPGLVAGWSSDMANGLNGLPLAGFSQWKRFVVIS
jgi:hypothetical protein